VDRTAVAIGAPNKRLVVLPSFQASELKISTQFINKQLSVEGGPMVAGVAIDVDCVPIGGNVTKFAESGF